jgi:hypothetical protein
LIARDLASINDIPGGSTLANGGTLELTTSVNLSGNTAGTGGLLIGGGLGSTMTLTNINGQVTNQIVGVSGMATLILDSSQGTSGTEIVVGQSTLGPVLSLGGGNVIFNPGSTPTTQIFSTTTFTGDLPTYVTAKGTVGQEQIYLGLYNWANGGNGGTTVVTSSFVRSSSDATPEYGTTVIFNGPLGGTTAAPTSDFLVTGDTFSAPAIIASPMNISGYITA